MGEAFGSGSLTVFSTFSNRFPVFLWENNHPQFWPIVVLGFFFFLVVLSLRSSVQVLCCSMQFSLVEASGLSCPVACGSLVPQPGTKPASPALEGRFLTTFTREVLSPL